MHLHRVVVEWSGPSVVGRAVNVLHFAGDNPLNSVAAILSAYANLDAILPGGVSIRVPGSGDTIDDTTGALTGVWSATGSGTTSSSGAGNAGGGVGACISWTTGGIVTGASGRAHKLRGRTFLVPLAAQYLGNDGHWTTNAMAQLTACASGLQAAGPLAVWHRPTTKGGSNGTSYGVISNRVTSKVAFLSSRRD